MLVSNVWCCLCIVLCIHIHTSLMLQQSRQNNLFRLNKNVNISFVTSTQWNATMKWYLFPSIRQKVIPFHFSVPFFLAKTFAKIFAQISPRIYFNFVKSKAVCSLLFMRLRFVYILTKTNEDGQVPRKKIHLFHLQQILFHSILFYFSQISLKMLTA